MKKTMKIIVLAVLCLNFPAISQIRSPPNEELKIGDLIPESLWNLKLDVLNNPNQKPQLSLHEYKDKLIILDFWATWCTACIGALPNNQKLVEQYSNDLIIIGSSYESSATILRSITENKILNHVRPFTTYKDTILKTYFPHKIVPHYVWIYKGHIVAISSSQAINSTTIEKVLQGKSVVIEDKIDIENYDYDISIVKSRKIDSDLFLLYNSAFLKYIPGLSSRQGIKIDSVNGTKRYYFINRPILALYSSALTFPFHNRVMLRVSDKSRFIRNKQYSKSWVVKNTYCYELTVPISTPESKMNEIMLNDLNHFLNLKTGINTQIMDCLMVVKSKQLKGKSYKRRIHYKNPLMIENLNNQIQSHPILPIILDSTEGVQFNIKDYKGDIATLNESLKSQGFYLKPTKEKIKVLLIEDSKTN